ncbi:MAG: Ig-like domain-containing protein, partial [Ginsengibacter sp.]
MKHTNFLFPVTLKKRFDTYVESGFFLQRKVIKFFSFEFLSYFLIPGILLISCSKKSSDTTPPPPPPPAALNVTSISFNGQLLTLPIYNISTSSAIKFSFSAPVDRNTVNGNFSFSTAGGSSVSFNPTFENNDSSVVIQPTGNLNFLTRYLLTVSRGLKSKAGGTLQSANSRTFVTQIDSTDK